MCVCGCGEGGRVLGTYEGSPPPSTEVGSDKPPRSSSENDKASLKLGHSLLSTITGAEMTFVTNERMNSPANELRRYIFANTVNGSLSV